MGWPVKWGKRNRRSRAAQDTPGSPATERVLEKEALLSEHALKESQRALSTLMATLPGMAYRCRNNDDRTMLLVSPGCTGVTGYQPDDLLYSDTIAFTDLIHPDDRSVAWETLQEALQQQRCFQLEYRLRRADETICIAWEQGQGVYSEDGELLFVEGFISDVTDQRSAEKALRESEAWYRALFEASIDAILLTDGERIKDCNSRTAEMFGYELDELRGMDILELTPEQQADGSSSLQLTAEKVKDVLRGRPQLYEWRYRRADGELFDAEVNLNRVDVSGRIFLQTIIREISDRKQAEAALERRDEMLSAVSFATARLLLSDEWEGLIDAVLEHFGEAADVSRAYLMETTRREDGEVMATKVHEWVASGVRAAEGKLACHLLFPKEVELDRWSESFGSSAVIHGRTSDFPEAERQILDAQEILSLAVVPVFVGGRMWGVLGIDECRKERAWTRGEKEAIRAAADILGGAVQLSRTRGMLDLRTRELEVLYRVGELLTGRRDVKTVLQDVADALSEGCELDHVAVTLADGEVLRVHAWGGAEIAMPGNGGMAVDGPGVIARAARTRETVHLPDVLDHPGGDERVQAEYAVPLVTDGVTSGVLSCASFTTDGIAPWHLRVLDRVAAQLASVLHHR